MIIKIIISVFLGLLIGMEREHCGKAVGIRTISLITLGATLFCIMSPLIGDNSRIVAQIVSGIGFIGAGIIFKNEDGIHGLTTAATVWASSAIGCLIGMDFYKEAIIGSIFIIIINLLFKYFKHESEKSI